MYISLLFSDIGFVVVSCAEDPCKNGGACIDNQDGFRCECPSGFSGSDCSEVDHCVASPCQNGGACVNDPDGFRCECPSGFTGSTCGDVDDCPAVNPCENGGSCVDGPRSYTCDCLVPYGGPRCQLSKKDCGQCISMYEDCITIQKYY